MMILPFAAVGLSLFALAADAQVRPLSGETLEGKIIQLTAEQVVVETKDGPKSISTTELMAVEFTQAKPTEKPTVWIDLVDGSRLVATSYAVTSGKASVDLIGGWTVEIPTRSITSVRFRQQDADLARQWREILAEKPTGDLLVIRKTSTRMEEDGENEPKTVTETALDQLDGAVLNVTPGNVQFQFDGDTIDVKREKIEGIVYYHAASREIAVASCRIVDAGGSQWSVRSVQLKQDMLAVVSAAGVSVELPLSQVAKIDFSIGNIANLAELEPDGGDETVVSLQPAALGDKFGRLFRRSSSPPFGAEQFRIAGKTYSSGLSLHSPSNLVYRVPEGFRRLHAVAGVDDSILVPGHFVLLILGDGKELARHEFNGPEQRGPVLIDVEISGVKRISVVLDPADGQDIGDQLNLCEARLTK